MQRRRRRRRRVCRSGYRLTCAGKRADLDTQPLLQPFNSIRDKPGLTIVQAALTFIPQTTRVKLPLGGQCVDGAILRSRVCPFFFSSFFFTPFLLCLALPFSIKFFHDEIDGGFSGEGLIDRENGHARAPRSLAWIERRVRSPSSSFFFFFSLFPPCIFLFWFLHVSLNLGLFV